MYRWIAAVALTLVAAGSVQAQQEPPAEALDGVDVVILINDGKEVFGKGALRSNHDGLDYLFSTAETKAAFDRDPAKYAAQYGGLCARMGGGVRGNPSNYVLHKGKIYLFGSDDCRQRFIAAPDNWVERPATPMPESADAATRGRAILDRAAAAHGGAALDAVTSYAETLHTTQRRPTGDVTIVTKVMFRFPGGVRTERTVPLSSGPMTMSTVVTPAGGWEISGQGRSRAMNAAAIPDAERGFAISLLPLLKGRADAGVRVAALEPTTIGGVAVEPVRLVRGGLDVTLNVDKASGKVHSLAFYGRGDQGMFGDSVVTYSDYREVNGVLVPFAGDATFKGAPSAQLARKVESAAINLPLDEALFAAPKGGGQ